MPQLPGPSGVGTPSLTPNLTPNLTPSLTPSLTPNLTPSPGVTAAPPVSTQAAPPAAARAVRFRCEVAPQDASCREAGAPDGGDGDADCICGRDVCYDEVEPATGRLRRVCEKR
jgi:hypothetical protein